MEIAKVEFTVVLHTEEGLPYSKVTYVERNIVLDGELLYSSKIACPIYEIEQSPLRDFERWLLGEEQVKRSSNITDNRSEKVNLFRHGGFKGFNLKKKFFDIFRQKFFLSNKSPM